jgi:cytochrome d ubiquinol oxidase subunit II
VGAHGARVVGAGPVTGAPEVLAGAVLSSLTAYVLLAGADFGGGVWDLLATGPRRAAQRAVIAEAIGPVWEANHVWLILGLVLLFTCFPSAFAQLTTRLHIPLALALIGIVLRGSAFAFRSYGGQGDEVQRRWGRVFAIASVGTPVVLGMAIGAVAAGRVGDVAAGPGFYGPYVAPWLSAFPASVGVFALACFAFLAAVYLPLETEDPALRDDFRRRALIAGVGVIVSGVVALVLSRGIEPLQRGLLGAPWATPLHVLTGGTGVAALASLVLRQWRFARIAAASEVSLILWGWALGQYPYLVPPTFTIDTAAAPPETLTLAIIALGLGAAFLFPSLFYLFRVFKAGAAPAS